MVAAAKFTVIEVQFNVGISRGIRGLNRILKLPFQRASIYNMALI
jgi:hypothetical protein